VVFLVDISPFRFVEPSLELKMKSLAKARMKKEEEHDIDSIKDRLKKLRKLSLKDREGLLELARKNFESQDNVKTYHAKNASDAVNHIKEIGSGVNNFAINKSSTVAEILPALEAQSNVQIIDAYLKELKLEERAGDAVKYHFELPEISKGALWSSFSDTTRRSLPFEGARVSENVFIGLLGSNVVSADGQIFFMQHLHNISKILATAKKVIVIVGIDRIVSDPEDALFQVKCCGYFGLESVLLEMFLLRDSEEIKTNRTEDAKGALEKITYKAIHPKEIHIIFLDNGRTEIENGEYEELLMCIGCKACSGMCPRAKRGGIYKNPREVLLAGFSNGLEQAFDYGLFECTICGACENLCPVDIPLKLLLSRMRETASKEGLTPEIHKKLSRNIEMHGTPYGEKPLEVKDG
jgi:L-lactate utilization protein LutB